MHANHVLQGNLGKKLVLINKLFVAIANLVFIRRSLEQEARHRANNVSQDVGHQRKAWIKNVSFVKWECSYRRMDLSRTVKSVLRAGTTTVTKQIQTIQWIVLAAKFVCQAKVSQTHRVPVAWTACPDNSAVNLNKLNAKIATEENTRP